MQICHKSVKTVTGTLCSGTVVPYHRNSYSGFQMIQNGTTRYRHGQTVDEWDHFLAH